MGSSAGIVTGSRPSKIRVRDDGSASDGATVSTRDNVKTDVENLTGGTGNDTLTAALTNAVVNVLTGGGGDDRLKTRDGTGPIDQLVCGAGTDQYDRDASNLKAADCEVSAILP